MRIKCRFLHCANLDADLNNGDVNRNNMGVYEHLKGRNFADFCKYLIFMLTLQSE